MNNRDDEIDALLKPLRELSPSEFQLKRWQSAMKFSDAAFVYTVSKRKYYLQLTAAILVGAFLGGVLVHELSLKYFPLQIFSNEMLASATFEQTHTNLD